MRSSLGKSRWAPEPKPGGASWCGVADPAELAVRLSEVLTRGGIPHAIGGAIAYGFHAEPRATSDIDLNLFVDESALPPALRILESAGCVLDHSEALRRAHDRGDFIARLEGYRVDAFISFHAFHDDVRARVQEGRLLGRRVPILSAEDLILFKTLFDRPKDWLDITNLSAAKRIDREYVLRWARILLAAGDDRLDRLDRTLSVA